MKYWTKVIIIGVISFIALMTVSFFIAVDLDEDSNKVSGGKGTLKAPSQSSLR